MRLIKILIFTTFISGLSSFQMLNAQSYIGVQLNGIYGFEPNDLRLFDDVVQLDQSIGYNAFLQYSYKIKKLKIEPKFGIGVKQLQFEGSSVNDQFDGETSKISFLLGIDYKFYSDWIAGMDLIMENNLDFESFRAANSDLLRYNWQLRIGYKLLKRFSISAAYATALYPRVDHFLIANPRHQFSLGVQYKIFKL